MKSNMPSPYTEMQKAVDIVNTSRHPTNKIAATLFGKDHEGRIFSLSRTNYWPEPILQKIGMEQRIGNSSGTIHAETACIMKAPCTEGASLCVTDPFCPNCAKNMAEAGIRTVYIDHKGFNKDFVARRGDEFENMSMHICERAGISVYEIRRKEKELIPILEIDPACLPAEDFPVSINPVEKADEDQLRVLIESAKNEYEDHRFAVALAKNEKGKICGLTARSHPVAGCVLTDDAQYGNDQYSFMLEPVNRLLINAVREGLKIIDGLLYANNVPTSREQVNIVGAGLTCLFIGDTEKARDEDALVAMKLLEEKQILSFLL